MTIKETIKTILQIIAVFIILYIARMLISMIIPVPGLKMPPQEELNLIPLFLLIVIFMDTLIISYIVLRSSWYGWKLAVAVFVLIIGNRIFEEQIEAVFFIDYLGFNLTMIILLSLQVLLTWAIGSFCAVILFGKMKTPDVPGIAIRFDMSLPGWIIRWITLPLLFIFLYFLCGALIAWVNPAVRAYYEGGTEINLAFQALLQIPRGAGWFAMALLVAAILRGNRLENALCTGILFGVIHANELILPNAYMPYAVRMTHMVEIFISLFLFGCIAGFLIRTKIYRPQTEEIT